MMSREMYYLVGAGRRWPRLKSTSRLFTMISGLYDGGYAPLQVATAAAGETVIEYQSLHVRDCTPSE